MKKLLGMILVLTMVLSVFAVSFNIQSFDDNTRNTLEKAINSGNADASQYAAMSLFIMENYNFEELYKQMESIANNIEKYADSDNIEDQDMGDLYNIDDMKKFFNYMESSGGIEAMNKVSDYLEHVMGKYETKVTLSKDAFRQMALNIGMEESRMNTLESTDGYPETITADYRDFIAIKMVAKMIIVADENSDMYFKTLEKTSDLLDNPMDKLNPGAKKIFDKYQKQFEQTSPGIMDFDTILRDLATVDGDAEWVSLTDIFTDDMLNFETNENIFVDAKDMVGYIIDINNFEMNYYDDNRNYLDMIDILYADMKDEMDQNSSIVIEPKTATNFMAKDVIEGLSEANVTSTIKVNGEEVYTLRDILDEIYKILPFGNMMMDFNMTAYNPTLTTIGLDELAMNVEIHADLDKIKNGYNITDLNIKVKPGVMMDILNLIGYLGSASAEDTLTYINTVIDDIGFLSNEDGDLVMKMGQDDYYVSLRIKQILNPKFIDTLIKAFSDSGSATDTTN